MGAWPQGSSRQRHVGFVDVAVYTEMFRSHDTGQLMLNVPVTGRQAIGRQAVITAKRHS